MIFRTLIALVALSASSFAQEEAPPRAIPVTPDTNPPIARAVPAEEVPPTPPAIPIPKEVEDSASKLTGDPEADLFNYASMVYAQGAYDIAARQFIAYTTAYPDGVHLEGVYYRLGESQLKLADPANAALSFFQVVSKFDEGEFVAPAAYRLASLSYTQNDYEKALPYFVIAKTKATDQKIKVSSGYYRARCLQLLNRPKEAAEAYAAVSKIEEENPYREAALRDLASLQIAAGKSDTALFNLEKLIESSTSEDILPEALARAGLLLSDSTDEEELTKARDYLTRSLEQGATGYWKGSAQYALLSMLSAEGDHEAIADQFARVKVSSLPQELQPRLLLIAGDAKRKLGNYTQAITHYRDLERFFPQSPEAAQSGYLKLICFYKLNDTKVPEFVDAFVQQRAGNDPDGYVDKALLLKAETLFREEKYPAAAQAYALIGTKNIPDDVIPGMLYNRGWCERESNNPRAALSSFTKFLGRYPDHAQTPAVLAARAVTYRDSGDLERAAIDLEALIAEHSDSSSAELGLQQLGLIKSEKKDWQPAIDAFSQLLEKFPSSVAAAEANFYIGKANYELKNYEEAIPSLSEAVKLDSESYLDLASMHLILSNYFLERPDELSAQIEAYLKERPQANLTPKVLYWLGARRMDEKNYLDAARYLRLGSTPDRPTDTPSAVWDYLARSYIELERFDEAKSSIAHYLSQAQKPSSKARGHLVDAKAKLGAEEFDLAETAAAEGLALQKDGKINAELLLVQGDIALARGDHSTALARYVVVSEIFVDPELTPLALNRAASAYDAMGDKVKASATRKKLASKFPEFEG